MAAVLPLMGGRGILSSGCRTQGRQSQASPTSCSPFCRGASVLGLQARPCARARVGPLRVQAAASTDEAEAEGWTVVQPQRLRLDNLSPQVGARKKDTRKGRGYGAGQGGSCGFGMRGQKSRSGTGAGSRPGFEGGQTPIYRQMPKLRGIAGGMSAGVKKFVAINLRQLSASGKFTAGEEVTLELLRERNLLNVSGRERDMPLKVLGDGELAMPLTIHATQFSGSARTKIEAAGGTIVEVPAKIKWSRALGKERKAAAEEEAAKNPKPVKARKA